jgi:hypothetical protein
MSALTVLLLAAAAAPGQIPAQRMEVVLKGPHRGVTYVPQLGSSPLQKFATQALTVFHEEQLEEYSKFGLEILRENPNPMGEMVMEGSNIISINRPDAVSLYPSIYTYMGGAHPNRYYEPMTFAVGPEGPMRLKARDIFAGDASVTSSAFLMPILRSREADFGFDPDNPARLSAGIADRFIITPAGISWVFSPYLVASYAQGDIIVKAPWGQVSPYLSADAPLEAFAGHISGKINLPLRMMLPEGTMAHFKVSRNGKEVSTMKVPYRGGVKDFIFWYPKLNMPENAELEFDVEIMVNGRAAYGSIGSTAVSTNEPLYRLDVPIRARG